LIDSGRLSRDTHKRLFMHRIDGAEEIAAFSADSKFDTRWSFLSNLHEIGRRAGAAFLAAHFDAIGARSTLDLRMAYN
ncbi:MAG TPA: patatin-like phospholipase family protein, partial [Beijerinckiaceae bacterium]